MSQIGCHCVLWMDFTSYDLFHAFFRSKHGHWAATFVYCSFLWESFNNPFYGKLNDFILGFLAYISQGELLLQRILPMPSCFAQSQDCFMLLFSNFSQMDHADFGLSHLDKKWLSALLCEVWLNWCYANIQKAWSKCLKNASLMFSSWILSHMRCLIFFLTVRWPLGSDFC